MKKIKNSDKERRFYPASDLKGEKRVDGKKKIKGYSAVFNKKSEDLGGFYEVIKPGAFKEALKSSDVVGLFNHNPDHVLGRESSGTLELEEDNKGLWMQIELPDTAFAHDLYKMIKRGDIKNQSFAFQVRTDKWENFDHPSEMTIRTIEEVERLIDVSVVTFPAFRDTSVAARSLALARNRGIREPSLREVDKVLREAEWYIDPLLWEAQKIIDRYSKVRKNSQYFKKYNDPIWYEVDRVLNKANWCVDPLLWKAQKYITKYSGRRYY